MEMDQRERLATWPLWTAVAGIAALGTAYLIQDITSVHPERAREVLNMWQSVTVMGEMAKLTVEEVWTKMWLESGRQIAGVALTGWINSGVADMILHRNRNQVKPELSKTGSQIEAEPRPVNKITSERRNNYYKDNIGPYEKRLLDWTRRKEADNKFDDSIRRGIGGRKF